MTYPYVQGSPKHTSGSNGPITRIVIHATCSGTHSGGAMENAHYFQSATAGGLAHYVVDPQNIVQCCKEDTACWHAPPNHGSIGIELCDPQTGAAARWRNPEDEAMLTLAAHLVVEIASRTGVPLVRIGVADLKAGRHGICGHVDVSQAFGQSSHSDPGPDFPWQHFLELIAHAHQGGNGPAAAWVNLSRNSTGGEVRRVQHALGIPLTNVFDQDTVVAVRGFQHDRMKVTPTGVVDAATAHALGLR